MSSTRASPVQRRPPLQPGQRRPQHYQRQASDDMANTSHPPPAAVLQPAAYSGNGGSRFGTPIPVPTTPTRSTGYLHRGLASTRTKTPPPTLGVRRRVAPDANGSDQHYPPHYRFARLTAPGGGRQEFDSKVDPAAQAEAIRRDALADLDASSNAAREEADAQQQQSSEPIVDDAWMCSVLRRHLPPSVTKYHHGEERTDTIQRRSSGATLIIPTASEPIADWVQTTPSRNYVSELVAVQVAASSRTPRRAGGVDVGESEIRRRQRIAVIESTKLRADDTMFAGAVTATVARNKGMTSVEQDVWRAQQVRITSDPSRRGPLVGASRHSQSTIATGRAAVIAGSSLPVALSPRLRQGSPSSRQSSPQRTAAATTSHSVSGAASTSRGTSPRDGRTRSPSSSLRRCQGLSSHDDQQAVAAATPRTGPLVRRMLTTSSPSSSRAKSPTTNSRPAPIPVHSNSTSTSSLTGWLPEGMLINGSTARPYSPSRSGATTPTRSGPPPRRATTPTTPLRPYLQTQSPSASPDKRDAGQLVVLGEYVPQRSVFDEEERIHSKRQVAVGRRHVTVSKAKEVDVVAKKRLLFGLDLQSTPSYSYPQQRQQAVPVASIRQSTTTGGVDDGYIRMPESIFGAASGPDPSSATSTSTPPYVHRSGSAKVVETSAVGSRGLGAAKRRIHAHNELQADIRHLEDVSEYSQRMDIMADEMAAFTIFPPAERKDHELTQRALEVAAKRLNEERGEQEKWAEERRSGQRRSCWGQQAAMRTALEEQWANFHGHIGRNFSFGIALIECVVAPEVAVRSLVIRREAQLRGKIASLRTLCESTMYKVATGQQATTPHPALSPRSTHNTSSTLSFDKSPTPPSSHRTPAPQPTPHQHHSPSVFDITTAASDVSLGNLSGISQGSVSTGLVPSHDDAMMVVADEADQDDRQRRVEEQEEHDSINRSRGMTVEADGAAADLFEVVPATSDAVLQRFLSQLGNSPMGNALSDQECVRSTFHGRYHELITFEVCHEFGMMFGGSGGTNTTTSLGGTSRGGGGDAIVLPSKRRLPQEYDGFRRVASTAGTFLPFESVFPTVVGRKKERATTVSIIADEDGPKASTAGPSAEASMAMNAITNAACDVALNQFVLGEMGKMVAAALEASATDSD